MYIERWDVRAARSKAREDGGKLGNFVTKQRVRRSKTSRTGRPKARKSRAASKKRKLVAGRFKAGKAAANGGQQRQRVRLDPDARAAMILDEAVAYFAEHGFEAQVRELSDRLGVSPGLIFRYFGTKQNLIENVYQRVYVARWSDSWERLLRDRSQPMKTRLVTFYKSYLDAVDDFEWIRVSLFSGLAGYDLTRRYVMTRVEELLKIIMAELRRLGPKGTLPSRTDALHEIVWHLHSTFIYYLIRKYVFGVPVIADRDIFIDAVVGRFLAGLNADQMQSDHDDKVLDLPSTQRGGARLR